MSNLYQNGSASHLFNLLSVAFFDWYAATIPLNIERELGDFISSLREAFVGDIRDARPDRPYTHAFEFYCGDDVILKSSWGGVNQGIYVKSSSSNAPGVSDFLRAYYPDHNVPRTDVALDFNESGDFDSLVSIALHLADTYELKIGYAGDWHSQKTGRTLYIGSRKSVCMLRIYEKGKEQRDKGFDAESDVNWVRLELEIKPGNKHAKRSASQKRPVEFFGVTEWTRELAGLLGENDLKPCPMGTIRNKQSDLDRRLVFMLRQYGNTLDELLLTRCNGSYASLGEHLGLMRNNLPVITKPVLKAV